jgi:hypothetical protein
VALLIAGYSWRAYQLSKENKYAYFSLAFLLIGLSLFLQSFTSGVLYYTPVRDTLADVLSPATGPGLKYSNLFYRGAFFTQMVAMLSALLLIFFISQRSRERLRKYYEVSQIGLFVYLILLISIVSNFKYFVFYLTNLVLLGLITLNYYKNYLNSNRKDNAWKVMWAFMLVLLGNLFFIFVFVEQGFYAIGEFFMLLGFLLLLYVYHQAMNRRSRKIISKAKDDPEENGIVILEDKVSTVGDKRAYRSRRRKKNKEVRN